MSGLPHVPDHGADAREYWAKRLKAGKPGAKLSGSAMRRIKRRIREETAARSKIEGGAAERGGHGYLIASVRGEGMRALECIDFNGVETPKLEEGLRRHRNAVEISHQLGRYITWTAVLYESQHAPDALEGWGAAPRLFTMEEWEFVLCDRLGLEGIAPMDDDEADVEGQRTYYLDEDHTLLGPRVTVFFERIDGDLFSVSRVSIRQRDPEREEEEASEDGRNLSL